MTGCTVPSLGKGTVLETAESVRAGHPDKLADQIADLVLDSALSEDAESRVACEVLVSHGLVAIAGEFFPHPPYGLKEPIVRELKRIGYDKSHGGWNPEDCRFVIDAVTQTPELSNLAMQGVAGDQAVSVGYASSESESGIPLSLDLAHQLSRAVDLAGTSGRLPFLRADGKTQVTVRYVDGKVDAVADVSVSVQRTSDVSDEDLRNDIEHEVIRRVIPTELLDGRTQILVNYRNPFLVGGPLADTGLTGRKIVVDAYGPRVPVGGGSFSGKDPTKVDRTGAYLARYIAKGIVASGMVSECRVSFAFVKGLDKPAHVRVQTFGTEKGLAGKIERIVAERAPLDMNASIEALGLRQPIYRPTAVYGHFGRRGPHFPWENPDFAQQLAGGV